MKQLHSSHVKESVGKISPWSEHWKYKNMMGKQNNLPKICISREAHLKGSIESLLLWESYTVKD